MVCLFKKKNQTKILLFCSCTTVMHWLMEFSIAFFNSDLRGRGEYCASFKDQICYRLSLLPAQAEKLSFRVVDSWSICPVLWTPKYSDLCPILSQIHFAYIAIIIKHLFVPFLECGFMSNIFNILRSLLYTKGNVHVWTSAYFTINLPVKIYVAEIMN